MIAYTDGYVDDDWYFLPEPVRKLYRPLRQGEVPVRRWTVGLGVFLEYRSRSPLGYLNPNNDDTEASRQRWAVCGSPSASYQVQLEVVVGSLMD